MADYYQTHSQAYFQATFGIDPSAMLAPLANRLQPGATVLDVGCGSGRDLCWLNRQGFRPTGFERAPELAVLARQASGCRVIQGDFRSHDFSTYAFDGLLVLGSLVHLRHEDLPPVLSSISQALTAAGTMLLSLKKGQGRARLPDGRIFTLWQPGEVEGAVAQLDFTVVEASEALSPVRPSDIWLSYTLTKRGGKVNVRQT